MRTWPDINCGFIFCKSNPSRRHFLFFCFDFTKSCDATVVFYQDATFPARQKSGFRRLNILASGALVGGLWRKFQSVLDFADSDWPIHIENLPQKSLEVTKVNSQKSHDFSSYLVIVNGWISELILHQIKIQIFLVSLDISNYKYTLI